MAEEKIEQPELGLDSDTMDALQFVLHNVRGASPISVAPEFVMHEMPDAEGE